MPSSHPDLSGGLRPPGEVLDNTSKQAQRPQRPSLSAPLDTRNSCVPASPWVELDLAELASLIELLLRSKEAPHVLPVAREIAIAPAFLNALADHLAGTKRAWRDPCDASVQSLSNRLPKDFIRRRAFEKLVRDLIWEIEQPQAS